MEKSLRRRVEQGLNCGESPEYRPSISTAVTTFVFTPVTMWTLTQSCSCLTTPYLWSNQRTNRDVVKPLESMAKSDSTIAERPPICSIRVGRIGVSARQFQGLGGRVEVRHLGDVPLVVDVGEVGHEPP